MRPFRLILTIAACVLTVFILSFFAAKRTVQTTNSQHGRYSVLFDWRSPSSLFPPSAIISLTDDNSTFFLARPAAFGPLLPSYGLSGPLWIGTGFGDDEFGRGGVANAEGELGCSDVPGWTERLGTAPLQQDGNDRNIKSIASAAARGASKSSNTAGRRSDPKASHGEAMGHSIDDDGTDDHLHRQISKTALAHKANKGHADIQSIQESAEIAGKVVLLSRGGCGFLEKVMWVQRRGGTAVIVGDNFRGGALVTMWARDDTSNVTIPALFTSHTTAHLLSSLVPSGLFSTDVGIEEAKKLNAAVEKAGTSTESRAKVEFIQVKDAETPHPAKKQTKKLEATKQTGEQKSKGWFRRLFSESETQPEHDSRSPINGAVGWVLQEDFDATEPTTTADKVKQRAQEMQKGTKVTAKKGSPDGFVIGVQDWRDPDLLANGNGKKPEKDVVPTSVRSVTGLSSSTPAPTGGSITPGSGDYSKNGKHNQEVKPELKTGLEDVTQDEISDDEIESSRWFGRLRTPDSNMKTDEGLTDASTRDAGRSSQSTTKSAEASKANPHEGLWVTLQPTTVSASPFFDTLLVLVVSPLVTLTVVYALLLLRSRIRRRRWRAPKSVVDRLPVRTYHTIASTASTTSSASVSRPSTPPAPTATTPLLHSNARPIVQRPRSRTAGDAPLAGSSVGDMASSNLSQLAEKRETGLNEWRRKYGGRQRECVVCLEEYVDGVSRVMSLPCGHEFHADCITPWLTTRRRTCPICKGDVVRSLARSNASVQSSSATPDEAYDNDDHDGDEDTMAGEPLVESEDLERAAARPDRSR